VVTQAVKMDDDDDDDDDDKSTYLLFKNIHFLTQKLTKFHHVRYSRGSAEYL